MKLNYRNRTCFLIGVFSIVSLLSCCSTKEEKKPNVIFVLVDDLGWADLGAYGSTFYETPNIDKFAENNVKFTNAFAAAHTCSPSRASILTGKYPARINLTDWLPGREDFDFQKLKNIEINQHLPFEEKTLAEVLKENGYKTAIFGKWHLGEDPSGPLNHGFDIQVPDWNKGWPLSYHAPFKLEGLEGEKGEYLTERLTDEALNYIEDNKDKPFFLYLSHFAVHDPIQGPKDLVKKYEAKLASNVSDEKPPFILESDPDSKPFLSGNRNNLELKSGDTWSNYDGLSKEEQEALLEDKAYEGYDLLPNRTVKIKQKQDNVQFAGMVEKVDQSFGRVLAKLEELNLTDNTIVIFYSDNGGMAAANYFRPDRHIKQSQLDKAFSTSNLPLRGAKGWLYEGGIRVPLIIKWPSNGKEGFTSDVPVTSPDIYPTILEMVGLPALPEQHEDGVSIVPLLKGQKSLERDAIYWHIPHYSNHGLQSPGGAVRSGDYKLIEYYENGTVQLFNLVNDLGEQNDLSLEEPEKVKELQGLLKKWRDEVGAKMMLPNPNYDSNASIFNYKQ